MRYKAPLIISISLSTAGVLLLVLQQKIVAQLFFVLAFAMGILAFKRRAGLLSAIAYAIPACIMAFIYFNPQVLPFLTLAMIIAAVQNPFLEVFFPSKMYNNPYFKIVLGALGIASYLTANLLYSLGWQAWVFPGLMLLIANILSTVVVYDIFKLKSSSVKGYIKAGSVCPDFNLPDENGALVSKKDFEGKFLVIIFVRGDWCPGCHIMLRTYQRHKEKFAEHGVNLLSIGPDPLGVNKEMVQKLGLNYHVLSDEKQGLAKQFCVELQKMLPGAPQYDFIPLPASFLIDKKGVVRYTSRADKAGEILNPAQIFEVLDTLN